MIQAFDTPNIANDASERALMAHIHGRWDVLLRSAIQNSKSQISEPFLAALIANESGGDPDARRLEKHVFARLVRVQDGREREYGGITRTELLGKSWDALLDLATSWGLTQIMGFHALHMPRPASDLIEPEYNLTFALEMLRQAVDTWSIQTTTDAGCGELFRCWNAGSPHAKTFDANYAANGLARMEIYQQILRSAQNDSGGTGSRFMVTDPEICL